MDDRVKKALQLLDAFKACIDEHPIVGEWITEILKRAEQTEPNSSEIPNNCETHTEGVWNAGFKTGYDKGYKDAQKVKDSQDLVKDLVKAFCEDGTWLERQGVYTLTLAEAKQRAVDIIESVTQTETQNSNMTFEKRTMRDCYNCKKFETEGECIECHYEPKTEPNCSEKPNNCEYEDIFEYCPRCGMRILVSKPKDEPTWEQVKEYCNKRCLDIVDSAMRKQWYKDEPQTERSE